MEELYNSHFILPMLPWLAAPIVLVFALRARGAIGWLVAAFSVEIALDAWNGWRPVHTPPEWDWARPVLFVILGDLRFFAMVMHCVPGISRARAAALAVALAFVVPVATQVARMASHRVHDDPTVNYLVYELAFLALALVFRWAMSRSERFGTTGIAQRLTEFEMVQYGLWACADILILSGHSLGYGVRIAPNVLYYVAFLPFALWLFRSRRP